MKKRTLSISVGIVIIAGLFIVSRPASVPNQLTATQQEDSPKPGYTEEPEATFRARSAGNKTSLSDWIAAASRYIQHPTATKITLDPKRWYQLTNASSGLDGLFDGITDVSVQTGYGKIISQYDAYYPLQKGESMTLESVKFFDFEGSFPDQPMTLSIITDQWQRIPIATFTGSRYNVWVGPYPDRTTTGDAQFTLDKSISNARYLVINTYGNFPTEMELYGSYTASSEAVTPVPVKAVKLGDMLGVNTYEWNFEDGNTPDQINEAKLNVVKSFSGIRHYMDWNKLESNPGDYSYNPTLSGGWNYDVIYQRCKTAGIDVLACLKTLPDWLAKTYPADQQDNENTPLRYGKDFTDPNSYVEQAKVAFQYIARYGSNTNVNRALLSVNTTPRWAGDTPNSLKTGLGLISYIECDNERDKWWKGRKAYQTGREYAANLSAFYDGHKNSMGAGVGVKNADPNVKVVMGGLALAVDGTDYVRGMIDWCKQFRGYKADGTVNLCWDIINYHLYADNASSSQSGTSTRGKAPELTATNLIAQNFRKMAHNQLADMPIWVTETGYDVNQGSPIHAIPIGNKSALETQGDWILRTALLYAREGIEKVFFFQLYDDNGGGGMFGSSGLADEGKLARRPAADYLSQTNKLLGNYLFRETLSRNPFVDRYERNSTSAYVLVVPDETGRTASYTLDLGTATQAQIYRPKAGSDDMDLQVVNTNQGKLQLTVTETPLFVVAGTVAPNAPSVITETKPLNTMIRVYPNPTGSFVTIQSDRDSDVPLHVNVFDTGFGRLYQQGNIPKIGDQFLGKVDLSQLPAGTYLIEITQGGERVVRKIVKH